MRDLKSNAKQASMPRHIKRTGQEISGWLFCLPMIVILGLFLFVPIVMALWVSFSDWAGRGSPFANGVDFIGLKNYQDILVTDGLAKSDFGTAIRNNAWYTLLVVPLQTVISLLLAVLLNRKILKARSFFRTAFYFPSVTSSVAITVLWLFLFNASGSINAMLNWFGVKGPNWFHDPRGLVHILLSCFGIDNGPAALTQHGLLGISWWDWLSGPSVAMFAIILMVIFTTSGTFMLMFIAALQNIGDATEEAAIMDGANSWQRLWEVTVPQLKPTIFTVITLGIIGTWQVFRPNLHRHAGRASEDHSHPCLPLVQRGVQQPRVGTRRSHQLCAVRHHRRHDLGTKPNHEGSEAFPQAESRLRGNEA